ncbi:hypothetical protein D3C72_1540010 [compost metagenome]
MALSLLRRCTHRHRICDNDQFGFEIQVEVLGVRHDNRVPRAHHGCADPLIDHWDVGVSVRKPGATGLPDDAHVLRVSTAVEKLVGPGQRRTELRSIDREAGAVIELGIDVLQARGHFGP